MRATTLRAAAALLLGTSLAVVAPGAASTSSAAPRWAPADRATHHAGRADVHRRRPVHRATSSSPTAATASTSATPRTAPARARRPTPTGATPPRSRSAPASASPTNGSLVDAGETVGRGRLVYSSWRTMRARDTKSNAACSFNDFALVRVDRDDRRKVNPSVPFWGGPSGVRSRGLRGGRPGLQLRQLLAARRRRRGSAPRPAAIVEDAPQRLVAHRLHRDPGHPRRLRQRLRRRQRSAFGTLSTVAIAPLPGLQRGQRPGPRARLRPALLRHRRACAWPRAPRTFSSALG